jgi:hypothetical protein
MENPGGLDPDLADQIATNASCLRALEDLRAEDEWRAKEPPLNPNLPNYFVELVLPKIQSAQPPPPKDAPPSTSQRSDDEDPPIEFGQMRRLKSQYHVWTGSRLARRWNWSQFRVLVVRESVADFPSPVDDQVLRVVCCSHVDDLPEDYQTGPDEIELSQIAGHGPFVAHLWLNYPVLQHQLHLCAGEISVDDAENLEVAMAALAEGLQPGADERAGRRLDPIMDEETLEVRRRLLAEAGWIAAGLDAWLEYGQSTARVIKEEEFDPEAITQCVDAAAPQLVGALRSGETLNRVLSWVGTFMDFRKTARTAGQLPDVVTARAKLEVFEPNPDAPEFCLANWAIQWPSPQSPARVRGGEPFYVLNPSGTRLIGTGHLDDDGCHAHLVTGLWKDFQAAKERLVLLIPRGT